MIGFIAHIFVVVTAFRKSIGWGFAVLFVPFANLIFACLNWEDAGPRFLVSFFSMMASGMVLMFCPELLDPLIQMHPELAVLRVHSPFDKPASSSKKGAAAVDPALTEALLAKRDELLQRQDLYDRHATQLSATYAKLKTDREKIKGAGPALVSFNTRAAQYQDSVRALDTERIQLASLQQAIATATAEAAANTGKADAKLPPVATTAAGKSSDAPVTRADMDAAVQKIEGIVNQVPPSVTKPANAESWHYGLHPGASKPNFDNPNLIAGRQLYEHEFVSMDGAPGVFYRGVDCEFNTQTKFFYTHPELAKKRLSEAEIAEVERLYRVLGRCERELGVQVQGTR